MLDVIVHIALALLLIAAVIAVWVWVTTEEEAVRTASRIMDRRNARRM